MLALYYRILIRLRHATELMKEELGYFAKLLSRLPAPGVITPLIWFGFPVVLPVCVVLVSGAEVPIKAALLGVFTAYVAFVSGVFVFLLRHAMRPGSRASEKASRLLGLGDRSHGMIRTPGQTCPRGKRITEQEPRDA
jgi:hypothetical protein